MQSLPNREDSVETLIEDYLDTHDARLRVRIIERHTHLVRSLASKFVRPGVSVEDLVQCAWVGLIGAFDRFDPARGTKFSTFAVTCAVGEIKRYFRDKTWAFKAPRRLQELLGALPAAEERLSRALGRGPSVPEMAEALNVTEEEVLQAMELGHGYHPTGLDDSLTRSDGESSLSISEILGAPDPKMEALVGDADLTAALQTLDERNRRIIHARYMLGNSQDEVARTLGISQMHVSRLERKALALLRVALEAA